MVCEMGRLLGPDGCTAGVFGENLVERLENKSIGREALGPRSGDKACHLSSGKASLSGKAPLYPTQRAIRRQRDTRGGHRARQDLGGIH
jgi:hypothetical protein